MRTTTTIGLAAAALFFLSPTQAPAQVYYSTPVVQYYYPPTTSYYVDPATGGTVAYAAPVSPYITNYNPGPRVYGPGQYYSYSPFYYSPSYYNSGYTTSYYNPGYTTYYRTWRTWR
jgi:hypothetical protein